MQNMKITLNSFEFELRKDVLLTGKTSDCFCKTSVPIWFIVTEFGYQPAS